MVIVVGVVVKCALTTRNIPKEQRKYSNPNPQNSNDFYGRKELGQCAISGDYNPNIEATTYNNRVNNTKRTVYLVNPIIKRNEAYTYIHHNKGLHPVKISLIDEYK